MARQAQQAPRRAALGLRVDDDEVTRLDRLVASYGEGVTTRHKVAKKALLIGLSQLERARTKRSA